jgi:hypothetical protein
MSQGGGLARSLCTWLAGAAIVVGCSGGPKTLASGQGGLGPIAARNGFLYWSQNDNIVKVPTGGGSPVTLASGQQVPSSLAVDDRNVYWTNSGVDACSTTVACGSPDGSVVMVPVAGGAPTTLATGLCSPDSIAIDADSVYFVDLGVGQVLKVPIGGGAPTTLATGQPFLGVLAVDSTTVYWTTTDPTGTTGVVAKVPIGGGTPATVASGGPRIHYIGPEGCGTKPANLYVDSSSVYWASGSWDGAPGSLLSAPLGGGNPVTLASLSASASNYATAIAGDGTSIYWWDVATLRKTPEAGGATTTVVSVGGMGEVGPFVLDGDDVYWTEPNAGKVLSAPKSP